MQNENKSQIGTLWACRTSDLLVFAALEEASKYEAPWSDTNDPDRALSMFGKNGITVVPRGSPIMFLSVPQFWRNEPGAEGGVLIKICAATAEDQPVVGWICIRKNPFTVISELAKGLTYNLLGVY